MKTLFGCTLILLFSQALFSQSFGVGTSRFVTFRHTANNSYCTVYSGEIYAGKPEVGDYEVFKVTYVDKQYLNSASYPNWNYDVVTLQSNEGLYLKLTNDGVLRVMNDNRIDGWSVFQLMPTLDSYNRPIPGHFCLYSPYFGAFLVINPQINNRLGIGQVFWDSYNFRNSNHLFIVEDHISLKSSLADSGELMESEFEQSIQVTTGAISGAGTDANVFVRIYGAENMTTVHLNKALRGFNVLENGDRNEGTFRALRLGEIKSIEIYCTSAGTLGEDWFCVDVVINGKRIIVDRWIRPGDRVTIKADERKTLPIHRG